MFINLTNIDFCPGSGGGSANLQEDKSVTYTANGSYTINPDEGYDGLSSVGVTVNYDGTDYRNQNGTVDFDGLRAIGWDETSINYFNANVLHYPWENDNYKVTDGNKALYGVVNKDNVNSYSSNTDFIYCPYFDTAGVTSMAGMFNYFYLLQNIPLLDTSNVTDMSSMFYYCYELKTIPKLDTSKVTSMESMFSTCKSLRTIPRLDTSSVKSIRSMFYRCSILQSIPQLDTSNVTSMYNTFAECTSLQTIPPLDTSKVTTMSSMFAGCTSLQSIPQLDTSNVTEMDSMFTSCSKLQTIPELDTSNASTMSNMFYDCGSLQSIPQLDTSKVTNMNSMFKYCNSLQTIPPLDTSKVINMTSTFTNCSSLQTIQQLDMTNVTVVSSIYWNSGIFDGCSNLSYIRLVGSLNVGLSISATSKLDYDSVKSILTAASNTTNTDSKTLKFNSTQTDQNGELAALVSTCTSKGWTIEGLTLN